MATDQTHAHAHEDHPTGWKRYVYSTNHKDIGTMYLVFAIFAGIIGGAMSVVMRMELQAPGDGVLNGDYHLYNVLVTGHGLIMIVQEPWPQKGDALRLRAQLSQITAQVGTHAANLRLAAAECEILSYFLRMGGAMMM